MGFVPQEDVMMGQLTVAENLLFSARYRLPARCSHSQRLLLVERAIEVLQVRRRPCCWLPWGARAPLRLSRQLRAWLQPALALACGGVHG